MKKIFVIDDDSKEFEENLRRIIRNEFANIFEDLFKERSETKLLSREDVMKLLNISPATLNARKNDGTLPFIKIGRRVYFDRNSIEQLLKSYE
jgi:predicted DNA-binding transcriptional regulator AlpA